MKFVIAQMKHESHTFIPERTALQDFNLLGEDKPLEGRRAVELLRNSNSGLAAFIQAAESIGADYSVPVAGEAWPLGPTEDAAFEYFSERITAAVSNGCDAVLLDLHGSMVTPSHPDAEGELLQRIRLAAPGVPIAVALDFHCTMTPRMVDNATVITIYRTTPHVDMLETGRRAAETLIRHLREECRAVTVALRIPLMASLEKMGDKTPPMQGLIARLRQMEADHPHILNAGLSGGHPFTDVSPGGMTAVIVTDNDPGVGLREAESLLRAAWDYREELVYRVEPYRRTLAHAKTLAGRPVVMADSGDIPSSGGYGADMTVLQEAVAMDFEDLAAGPIFDPVSLATMFEAGIGAEITLRLGGRMRVPLLNYASEPLEITGTVQALVDKPVTMTGQMFRGLTVYLGRLAVLSTGKMEILVSEKRSEALDLGIFTHVGIDPEKKKYILIKSRQHFRAAFGPIAAHMMWICGPGPTSPDFTGFPFKQVKRPIFPLDDDTPFAAERLGGL